MPTRSRFFPVPRVVAVSIVILLGGGCSSHKNGAKHGRPSPSVVDATEVLRREQVVAQARELMASGKYQNSNDAINAANRENPAPGGQPMMQWSAEYAQRERQKAAQEKFQSDFAKANKLQ